LYWLERSGFIGLAYAPELSNAVACVAIAGFGGQLFASAATALVARLYPKGTGKDVGLVAMAPAPVSFPQPALLRLAR